MITFRPDCDWVLRPHYLLCLLLVLPVPVVRTGDAACSLLLVDLFGTLLHYLL